MLFNSLEYLLFLPIVAAIYFLGNLRMRWVWLLCASYFFYMSWKAEYLTLIFCSTLVVYVTGILIGKAQEVYLKKLYVTLSILINLGILFFFKYYNFISTSINDVVASEPMPLINVLLPVGISFYTFQALGYTIDVYRGTKKYETNFCVFALYISYFPQLVAGPIERSSNLLPQFYTYHKFDYQRVTDGMKLILWGLFKKIVIADRLAVIVNEVYNNPGDHNGFTVIMATYFFAFQIYCDFSGYSDIAIGSSKILGYDLMKNFNRPYFAKSIAEFWRRWHISLSSWFRDYLYIPLGGNKVKFFKWILNILITFTVSGLWHGANWTFVIWGMLHGTYFLLYKAFNDLTRDFITFSKGNILTSKIIPVIVTFHLVCFAWIFFRANSVGDAFAIITSMTDFESSSKRLLASNAELALSFLLIGLLLSVHLLERSRPWWETLKRHHISIRWTTYLGLIWGILIFGSYEKVEFIYFQF